MEKKQFKDEGMRSLFQTVEDNGPSFGMDDRIMKAIAKDAAQQALVQKNMRRAMLGVAASLVVVVLFILSTSGIFGSSLSTINVAGFSLSYPIMLSFVGLILLFIEMELVVKYWWQRKLAE